MVRGRGGRAWFRSMAWAALLLAWPLMGGVSAQERGGPRIDLAAGWVWFVDDTLVDEGLIGAALRFHITPRLSVGPELGYIDGDNHSHLVLTGNVTWDLVAPDRRPRVVPFLVAGAGLYQTRETFRTGPYTSSEGAFTAGGGVRARVSERISVGVESRMGWEPHLRINGFVTARLGR